LRKTILYIVVVVVIVVYNTCTEIITMKKALSYKKRVQKFQIMWMALSYMTLTTLARSVHAFQTQNIPLPFTQKSQTFRSRYILQQHVRSKITLRRRSERQFSSLTKMFDKEDQSTDRFSELPKISLQEGKPRLDSNSAFIASNEPMNDTIAISSVGTALTDDQQEKRTKAASEIILSIDPATIEVVTFTGLAQEGEVYGGPVPIQDSDEDSNEGNNSLFSFVNMFRGCANYIANHRNTIVVYHIPGDLLQWDGFSDLMDDIALTWILGVKPVIIVGCRKQVDDRLIDSNCSLSSLSADGKSVECDDDGVKRYDSVRITDLDTLRIVKEEAGYVRFEVERHLGRALHLHGTVDHNALKDGNVVSGNFYSAQPYGVIDGVDFMYTGSPRRIEAEKIEQVLKAHDVVLLTSLGTSPSGEIFNVNSEHLAACVAGSLKASKVIYFTVNGLAFREVNSEKLVQNLKFSDAKRLLNYNKVYMNSRKGFATIEHDADLSPHAVEAFVKTGWSISALEKGVKRAHIIAPINGALLQELYTRDGSGTLISRDIYEGIRNANVNDVAGIYEMIEPFIASGYLVDRPKNVLEKDISSYYVFTRDNLIIACAQLKLFENGFAEIGCMVVKKEYRSQGRGDAMLCFLERMSVLCDCPNVFVLSTQTMEWFVEHGYKGTTVDQLPPSRKEVYNHQRKSKIYMKRIKSIRELDAAELWWNR